MGWLIEWRMNNRSGGPPQLLRVRDVVEFALRATGDSPAGHGADASAYESQARNHQNWERRFQLTVIPSLGNSSTVRADDSDPLRVEFQFNYPGAKTLVFSGTPRQRAHATAASRRAPQRSAAFPAVQERVTVEALDERAFADAVRRGRVPESLWPNEALATSR